MVEDLNKINALLRVRKIPMIVVLQPFGHHVSPTAWPGRQKHGLEMDAVYNPAYFEHFQSLSFDVLDLRNSFINYNNTDSLFYDQDGHWTKDGHKLVAEVIYDFLLKTNY